MMTMTINQTNNNEGDVNNIGSTDSQERIQKALQIAFQSGGCDGAHHKAWTIDQMVRALTGCQIEVEIKGYRYEYQGESEEYKKWVAERCDGEDGPNTYEWEIGTAP
jgi:hypothetical protein